MIRAIIFDLDGTLCDTIPDIITSVNETLKESGFPKRTYDEIKAAIGRGALNLIRQCLPEECREDEKFVKKKLKEYNDCYTRHYMDDTVPFDGIIEAVVELKKAGYKLAILSNKPDFQCKRIVYEIFGKGVFDIVMGHEMFPVKPDPSSSRYIMSRFGSDESNTIFVGDSNVDMNTAVNANVYPLGVSWGYRDVDVLLENGAKSIVNTPKELVEEINRISAEN